MTDVRGYMFKTLLSSGAERRPRRSKPDGGVAPFRHLIGIAPKYLGHGARKRARPISGELI